MKKTIEVAVNYEKVVSEKRELDLPEVAKYYAKNDDGKFFPRGEVLFAILPKYENNPTNSYFLVEVEQNKQDSNDFIPHDDCKEKSWLSTTGVRKTAYGIMKKSDYDFKEITAEEFNSRRMVLLDHYKTR